MIIIIYLTYFERINIVRVKEDGMAIIKCKECQNEISSKAEKCPYCGVKVKRLGCGGLFVLFFIIAVIAFTIKIVHFPDESASSKSFSSKLSLTREQLKGIEEQIEMGYLEIDSSLNKAYISRIIWNGIDAKTKENFAYALAIYVGNEKGTHLYWVDIIDKQSGKKLAKYSRSFGFKIYD